MTSSKSLADFLESECAELTKNRLDGVDFAEYLNSIFSAFIAELGRISDVSDLEKAAKQNIPIVQKVADGVVSAVRKYYDGSPSKAFACISELINQESGHFVKLCSAPLDPALVAHLYRLRANERIWSREQMFHIPFEARHKVTAKRYSIPGFPCLYLGSSAYICWRELGCPPFDKVCSARFKSTGNLNVLDFGFTPRWLARAVSLNKSGKNNKELFDFLFSATMFWPLVAASSIRVIDASDSFKPEYIVPQLVMQYVKDHPAIKINGIRYFSMHYEEPDDSKLPEIGSNFVFPVKSPAASGYCSTLRRMFEVMPVLPWRIAKGSSVPWNGKAPDCEIDLVRNNPSHPATTIFGDIEKRSSDISLASPI